MMDTWWIAPDQMNDEQRAIVRLRSTGNYLVVGPPGSGKTNALMLRAEYLNKSGSPDFRIVVFTRALRAFLDSCPGPYAVAPDRLKTLLAWQFEMIRNLGGRPSKSSSFLDARIENSQKILELLKGSESGLMVDTVLLDEAQDFTKEEIQIFQMISRNVFAVADSRQQIYEEKGGLKALEAFCEQLPLTRHYRNGQKICMAADAIGKRWAEDAPPIVEG